MITKLFKTIWYAMISIVFLWFLYVISAGIVATFIPSLLQYYP
jgi:hypothetical protein